MQNRKLKGSYDYWITKIYDNYSNKINGSVYADLNSNYSFDSSDIRIGQCNN
ncbi:MAG: hypothetical protein IPK10_18935 [Bacteroidetes bacterium]|nr:hypothetical protein [Bacteroidota bacterium]